MPEITAMHIAILAGCVAAGVVIGWIMRSSRCTQEKVAVNEGWQQQLSEALKEAFARRDELQRELKDIRSNLEVAVQQREKLQSDMETNEARGDNAQAALREKDDKIFRLSRELESWQNRLPPLIERFRERDLEAAQLEDDLQAANERIEALEAGPGVDTDTGDDHDETRVEAVNPESLGDELDASNDPSSMTQTGISDVLDETSDDNTGDDETVVAEQTETDVDEADEPAEEEAEEADVSAEMASFADYGSGNVHDDLKLIKGIGPAIEKTLNELGIVRFDQIADMSEYEIDRVAQRLKGFRTRIYREDWIGQARDLQLQKTAN
jgi:predicted flap endonuclease-1-like 5' DNA nuclease